MRFTLALLISCPALCQIHEASGQEFIDDDCTVLLQGSRDLRRRAASDPLEVVGTAVAAYANANETSQHEGTSIIPALLHEVLQTGLQAVTGINETTKQEIASKLESGLEEAFQTALQAAVQTAVQALSKVSTALANANQTSDDSTLSGAYLELGEFKKVGIGSGFIVFTMVVLTLVKYCSTYALPIPLYQFLGFGISLIGVLCAISGGQVVLNTQDAMMKEGSSVDISSMISGLIASFVVMQAVNTLVLVDGIVGEGFVRKAIFGGRSHWFVQWMIGPGFITVFRFIVWVLLFVHLVLSYACYQIFVLLELIGTMCGSSSSALDSINIFLTTSGFGAINTEAVSAYCNTSSDTSTAAFLLWIGCVFSIIGQIVMLNALASEAADIAQEMDRAWSAVAASVGPVLSGGSQDK